MRRPLGGFGLVALVIVVAVVLVLAARQWQAVAPTAAEVRDARDAIRPAAASTAADQGQRPGLGEMRDRTSEHADAVADALAATE
jgi:hypothetical protein